MSHLIDSDLEIVTWKAGNISCENQSTYIHIYQIWIHISSFIVQY